MTARDKQERRKSLRKKVHLPIKLMGHHNSMEAHMLNINGRGIKLEFTFKTSSSQDIVNKILSASDVHMEIGKAGSEAFFISPIIVKWSLQKDNTIERIYEVGVELKLSDLQQQTWEQFYKKL